MENLSIVGGIFFIGGLVKIVMALFILMCIYVEILKLLLFDLAFTAQTPHSERA